MENSKLKNPEFPEVASQIYSKLMQLTEGEAMMMLLNAKPNGLLAWRRLVHHYDPNNRLTRRRLLGQVLNPGKVENMGRLHDHIQAWINKKGRYEKMSKLMVEEEYACGIITEMCPKPLRDHLEMNSERLKTYSEIYQGIVAGIERHSAEMAHNAPDVIAECGI